MIMRMSTEYMCMFSINYLTNPVVTSNMEQRCKLINILLRKVPVHR